MAALTAILDPDGTFPGRLPVKLPAVDEDGHLVCECVWEKAKDFEEGFARVFDGKHWGSLDTSCTLIGECRWDLFVRV